MSLDRTMEVSLGWAPILRSQEAPTVDNHLLTCICRRNTPADVDAEKIFTTKRGPLAEGGSLRTGCRTSSLRR